MDSRVRQFLQALQEELNRWHMWPPMPTSVHGYKTHPYRATRYGSEPKHQELKAVTGEQLEKQVLEKATEAALKEAGLLDV